jgi:ADP-dependent NAD(P)H-hydrate dehydratase / NAD(P)H-hydrate epimerase
VIPVLFPDEVRALDAAAPVSNEVLIERAGHAVAVEALKMLGGAYGRRVIVVAGPRANGADALVAARLLQRRGVRVQIIRVDRESPPPLRLPKSDLVIDGAYGISLNGAYMAPDPSGALVLSVDIPSGLDPATGLVHGDGIAVTADVTVTFAGMKPGLLLGDGPEHCGRIVVADIGLDAAAYAHAGVMTAEDVAHLLPSRDRTAHKWDAAVLVVAGSPGMTGAPMLVSQGALRAGAGMVRLAVPGQTIGGTEAVAVELPAEHWSQQAISLLDKCGALVIGPGLGRDRTTRASVRQVLSKSHLPTVIDADAIMALAPGVSEEDSRSDRLTVGMGGANGKAPTENPSAMVRALGGSGRHVGETAAAALRAASSGDLLPGQRAVLQAASRRIGATPAAVAAAGTARTAEFDAAVRGLAGRQPGTTILTPHEGEFNALTGSRVSPDRFADVRRLAAATGAVVLLKGPTTLIASPDGFVTVVLAGDQRLATAGTGDVLAGVIGALLAQGLSAVNAASVGAWLHGTAALAGLPSGLVAGDLPALVARVVSNVGGHK